jgi:hypothetical protein
MGHWFDDLTRKTAKQFVSRRSMLSWTAKLGVAAAGAGLLGRTPLVASAAPAEPSATAWAAPGTPVVPTIPAGTCVVDDSYGVLRTVVTTSSDTSKMTLTHTFMAEVASGNTFSSLIVKSPDDIVLRMVTSSLGTGPGRAHAIYGPAYTGAQARQTDFATDGKSLEGSVDGRALELATLGADFRTLKYKDGKPGNPETSGAAGVQQAVDAILLQARSQLASCVADKVTPRVVATCTECQLGCREAWLKCSVASSQSSLACGAHGPSCYLASANATCDAVLRRCFSGCKSSGACCPDFCKGEAGCCQSAWGCCPPAPDAVRPPAAKGKGRAAPVLVARAQKDWSTAWPTCPRCGPPVTASAPTNPRPGNGRAG